MIIQSDIKEMKNFVASVLPDCSITDSKAKHEYFHMVYDGVRFIFYPHQVRNTGNNHIRVRNGTPERKRDFIELVAIMDLYEKELDFSNRIKVNNTWNHMHQDKQLLRSKYNKLLNDKMRVYLDEKRV